MLTCSPAHPQAGGVRESGGQMAGTCTIAEHMAAATHMSIKCVSSLMASSWIISYKVHWCAWGSWLDYESNNILIFHCCKCTHWEQHKQQQYPL